MEVYKPNSIRVPPNSGILRKIPVSQRLHQPNETGMNIDPHDVNFGPTQYNKLLQNVDLTTIFYDVFFDYRQSRLIGLGPRLFNLAREILPLYVRVNGEKIKYRFFEEKNCFFFLSDRLYVPHDQVMKVEFNFKKFTYIAKVSSNDPRIATTFNSKPNKVSISTLSRNNRVEWVTDWIKWHFRLHNIKRVVLYDNCSANRTRLIRVLAELNDMVEIILVYWDFPYGVSPFDFTQQGSLNHNRLRFCVEKGYCINLDIDEYLVRSGKTCISEYLDSNLGNSYFGAIRLKELKLPNIRKKGETSGLPRIFDFQYRFKKIGHNPTQKHVRPFSKYIYKFDAPIYLKPHDISFSSFERFRISTNYFKIWYWRSRGLYRREKMKRTPLIEKNELPNFLSLNVSENEFFFFHVLGLGINWKKVPVKEIVEYDGQVHDLEPLVQKLCKEAFTYDELAQMDLS